MADEVKKVGIQLTAEGAKEFKQSLKDIAASSKEAYSELKLAQSQYDKNTSSAKKLADKQEYLAKQVDNYTNKEKVLKAQLEEMEKAENRDEAAISKKRAEINECEAKLNGYKKSLEETTKQIDNHSARMKEWGDKLQAVGGKMTEVGDTLTKGVTAPIVAVGAASVAAFNEVDEGMDIIAKKTGATGDALSGMEDIAKNLAMTIPTSFETAGNAVGEVSTRFELTGDDLEDLSGRFIKFAEINETDVTSSIDKVQKLMAAWGVDASDAGGVLDLLTAKSQESGVSVETLAESVQKNKVALSDMGLSMEDSVALLAELDKNGIETSDVMAGMKKALVNAAKEGKTSKQAFAELEERMKGTASDTEAAQIAMELFGNKAGPAIASAVRDGKLSFEDLGTSLEDFAGTVDETFETIQDPADKMKTTINTLKATGASIVETAGPLIADLMTRLASGAASLKEKWDGLSEGQKQMILTIAGLAAAIGPVLSIGGRLISGIGTLLSMAPMLSTAITTLSGPIGIAIVIIGALVAAGVLLYKNWDKICEWANNLKEKVAEAWNETKEKVTQTVENIKTAVSQKWEAIKSSVTNAANNIKNGLTNAWNSAKNAVVNTTENMKSMLQGKLNNIKAAYEAHGGGIKGIASAAVTAVKEYWTAGFDAINTLTGGKLNAIKDKFTSVFSSIKSTVQNAISNVKSIFSNLKLSLPHIKLPHFSISGSFSLSPPSVPHLTVDWYKRAMTDPVIFTRPTVLGTSSGLKGFGDAGAEVVMGLNTLQQMAGTDERVVPMLAQVLSKLDEISNRPVYLNSREITRAMKDLGFNQA